MEHVYFNHQTKQYKLETYQLDPKDWCLPKLVSSVAISKAEYFQRSEIARQAILKRAEESNARRKQERIEYDMRKAAMLVNKTCKDYPCNCYCNACPYPACPHDKIETSSTDRGQHTGHCSNCGTNYLVDSSD